MSKAEIYANGFTAIEEIKFRDTNDYMQPETTLAVDKVCRIERQTNILSGVLWGSKTYNQPVTGACCEIDTGSLPVEFIGVEVVTSRTEVRTGPSSFPTSFVSSKGRLKRFGSFQPGLNNQVTDQALTVFFNGVVGSMVKFNSVLFGIEPAVLTNKVKSLGKFTKSMFKDFFLSLSSIQFKFNCSLHSTYILPYM
ncbi:MAG: hypothetical protein BGO39_20995 [Chloroflexi bacterium 54-19]|nr:MAG: hypothetical protein BGO39_20995 [Chloroflexi bacterium 54-19]